MSSASTSTGVTSPTSAPPSTPAVLPPPTDRETWIGLALALVGSIAFSGKAIIVKLAYRHGVDAITLVMLRMAMALPLFLLLSWWAGRGKPALTKRDWRVMFGLGFSGYYLASLLDFLGLSYISASLERLILYLMPTLVLLLGAVLFKRPVKRSQLLSLAVSYAGVLLVFGKELHLSGQNNVVLGAALVLGSAVSYALYLVYCGEEVKRLGSLRLTGVVTSLACLLCIGQFLLVRPLGSVLTIPTPVLWLSLLNAIACTFAPVILVMMAIERIGASMVSQAGMVGPMSTIAMGVLLLDEPFTLWLAAGTVLVFGGVSLLARSR